MLYPISIYSDEYSYNWHMIFNELYIVLQYIVIEQWKIEQFTVKYATKVIWVWQ